MINRMLPCVGVEACIVVVIVIIIILFSVNRPLWWFLNQFTNHTEGFICELAWAAFPKSIVSQVDRRDHLVPIKLMILLGKAAQANLQTNCSLRIVNQFSSFIENN